MRADRVGAASAVEPFGEAAATGTVFAHGAADADLQRGSRAPDGRAAGDPRIAGGDLRARPLRLLRPQRHPQAGDPEGRAGCLRRAKSEEHTSELQSLMRISYAVFCLKKK